MVVTEAIHKTKTAISYMKLCYISYVMLFYTSLNPGFTKALKGIENVKKLDGGGAELDSGDDADEMENSNVDRLSIDDEVTLALQLLF